MHFHIKRLLYKLFYFHSPFWKLLTFQHSIGSWQIEAHAIFTLRGWGHPAMVVHPLPTSTWFPRQWMALRKWLPNKAQRLTWSATEVSSLSMLTQGKKLGTLVILTSSSNPELFMVYLNIQKCMYNLSTFCCKHCQYTLHIPSLKHANHTYSINTQKKITLIHSLSNKNRGWHSQL